MTLEPAEPASYRSQRHPSSILEAIQDHWNSCPILLEHFPGGLYVSEVPERLEGEELVVPYAYVDKTQSDYTWTMTTQYMETCDVDFFLFAPGAELAENCLKSLRGVYDWIEFQFSDNISSVVYMRPEMEELSAEATRYRDGRLLYRGHVRYALCVNRFTINRRS
jgi:hypothetical protein